MGRQMIEGYNNRPVEAFGSTTVTQGIKIDAVGYYLHFFSNFDKNWYGSEAKFFFSYQIRISVDESFEGDFPRMKLTVKYSINDMTTA